MAEEARAIGAPFADRTAMADPVRVGTDAGCISARFVVDIWGEGIVELVVEDIVL